MKLNSKAAKLLIVSLSLCVIVEAVCPNNCSGHGKCENSVCKCFSEKESGEFYIGADCSLRGCSMGNSFSAVHSKQPSENGLVDYVRVNRELSEYNISRRELAEPLVAPSQISLINTLDGEVGRIWKVSGLEDFIDLLPPSGGTLSCKFTTSAVQGRELAAAEPEVGTVDVIGYGENEKEIQNLRL